MNRTESVRKEKRTSLSPQTLRVQSRLASWTKSGRKHWDLFRWLMEPHILLQATLLVVANDGAAGLDGIECKDIKGKEWEYATRLSHNLRNKTYRPGPVRRAYIPKKDGQKRPLGINDLDDRVVQRALTLLLEPIYEQIFLPCSYGFRPQKSATECVAQAAHLIYSHRYILEADIESFFDRVSHSKLLGMLKETIVDPRILNLISLILKAGFQEPLKPWQPTEEGTPQGGPLSPLLANIYLHYSLDTKFQQFNRTHPDVKLLRYADDFIVLSRTKTLLQETKRQLKSWMKEAKLNLKESKTKMIDMRMQKRSHHSKFDFLGFKIHLRAFKDNPNRFWVARQPSEKARKSLRENLKERISPQLSPTQVAQIVSSVWQGWSNYFKYGNSNHIFYREVKSVKRRVWWYLRMKYRRQRRPVPWRRLIPLGLKITRKIRPIRVLPDSWRQAQMNLDI